MQIKLYLILLWSGLYWPFSAQSQDATDKDKMPAPILQRLADSPKPLSVKAGKADSYTFPPYVMHGRAFFSSFDSDNGLPLDVMAFGKATYCDSQGNLWIGTAGAGVSRYDGQSFMTFTISHGLPDDFVTSILEDRQGNMWFGTRGNGIARYDGHSFVIYNSRDGLAHDAVLCMTMDQHENVWIGTRGGGVSRFSLNELRRQEKIKFNNYAKADGLADDVVYSIAEDAAGRLWFGTRSGGVSILDEKSNQAETNILFTNYNTSHGLSDNFITSISLDPSGNLWLGTYGGGINVFHPSRSESKERPVFTTYQIGDGLADNFIYDITQDHQGNMWIGTRDSGVSKFESRASVPGGGFMTFNTQHGLSNNSVTSIAEDQRGCIWMATRGGGVSKYSGESTVNFTTGQGLPHNMVISIAEDRRGQLWFGTAGGGVTRYDQTGFYTFNTTHGLANEYVNSILEDRRGDIWLATNSAGVSRYDGKTFTTYTTAQGLTDNSIYTLLEDNQGNIWMGSSGAGVSRYDGQSFTTYNTTHGLNNDVVTSITEDTKGNLWFGSTAGGVSRFDGKRFKNYNKKSGLSGDLINCIIQDRNGNLWFGTNGEGISILLAPAVSSDQPEFRHFNTSNGLADNDVLGMVEDKHGNIFIGTNLGIMVIPEGNLDGEFEYYNQLSGYPIRDINGGQNNGALYCDSRGIIWAGTGSRKSALTRFDYAKIIKQKTPPHVVIKSVHLHGEPFNWYEIGNKSLDTTQLMQQEELIYGKILTTEQRDTLRRLYAAVRLDSIRKFYAVPENLTLPFKHNAISFEYNAIETERPFMVHYQYKLEGMNDNWGPVTKKTEATFNNLSEGDYTFYIKAQSPWGVWSEPLTFAFTVLPPWYRSWWAKLLYVLIPVFLLLLLYKLRITVLQRQKKALEMEVRERTTEISSKNELLTNLNHEKDSILSIVAHDLRAPLNNIQGLAQLISLSGEVNPEQKDYFDKIKYSVELGNQLIKDLLDINNFQQGKDSTQLTLEAVDLEALFQELKAHSEPAAHKKHQKLSFKVPSPMVLHTDKLLLWRILENLLSNAIKYSAEGQPVEVAASTEEKHCRITVKDQGQGFSEEDKKKMFGKFQRLSAQPTAGESSTGLGLSIVKMMVDRLGGSIEVESQKGEGSTFIILLPNV